MEGDISVGFGCPIRPFESKEALQIPFAGLKSNLKGNRSKERNYLLQFHTERRIRPLFRGSRKSKKRRISIFVIYSNTHNNATKRFLSLLLNERITCHDLSFLLSRILIIILYCLRGEQRNTRQNGSILF